MRMSGSPTYVLYRYIYIYICSIYCILPVQDPVPVEQPTDAMPRSAPRQMPDEVDCILKCEENQKRKLESEKGYIFKIAREHCCTAALLPTL